MGGLGSGGWNASLGMTVGLMLLAAVVFGVVGFIFTLVKNLFR
jgi:hypothetical protein